MANPELAQRFLAGHIERLRKLPKKRIVFPEGDDPRIEEAAQRLIDERLVEPILIGARHIVPDARYARLLYERRRAKGMTELEANALSQKPLYYAALMVAAGDADGSVGGAANTTGETVRAALLCIGTAPKVKTVSSVMFVVVPDRSFGKDGAMAFADCAILIDPCATELAEIAIATAHSTQQILNVEPVVALLSFSTKGSGKHAWVDKVVEAVRIIHERAPELNVDGELQADAALMVDVAASKAPGSTVAGHANTLIFPDLHSGNIGYKLVERLAGGVAIGPFLQGLAKPANDLSRGCSADDVFGAAVITALQACSQKSQ